MAGRNLKWSKQAIDERVANLSNTHLLEEAFEAAQGDDYDGCFTERGAYEYAALKKELMRRLREDGFLLHQPEKPPRKGA